MKVGTSLLEYPHHNILISPITFIVFNVHIVTQWANRYITAFHIAISCMRTHTPTAHIYTQTGSRPHSPAPPVKQKSVKSQEHSSQLQTAWGRTGRKQRVVNNVPETMSFQSPAASAVRLRYLMTLTSVPNIVCCEGSISELPRFLARNLMITVWQPRLWLRASKWTRGISTVQALIASNKQQTLSSEVLTWLQATAKTVNESSKKTLCTVNMLVEPTGCTIFHAKSV